MCGAQPPASKIASNDLHLLIFVPLWGPYPHCTKIDLWDQQNSVEVIDVTFEIRLHEDDGLCLEYSRSFCLS